MRVEFNRAKLIRDDDGFWFSVLLNDRSLIQLARSFIHKMKNCKYVAEFKQYRKKRSKEANAYAWALMGKIADVVGSDKDEVYLEALERYGEFVTLAFDPEAVEQFTKQWRTVRELGKITVNGETKVQLQCYYGSSTYDSKQMSTLINGIVSECKDLGIETATPRELALLCEEWNR